MTVAFDAWKAGHVASTRHEVPVLAPKSSLKPEAVSTRLKGELIHPDRTAMLVAVRFSPDGRRLIAGDYPGGVVVAWDVASGKQLTAIETGGGFRHGYEYFFLTPDWRTLFSSREKRKLERVEQNGKELLRWTFDGEVRAWDLASRRLVRTYKHEPPRNILLMQLAPDGTNFLTFEELPGTYESAPKRAAGLWDVATGKYRPLPDGLGFYGVFSPDGRTVAFSATDANGYARALKLFDTSTGQEKLSVPIKDKNVWGVGAFSPDGRLMISKAEGWLRWWDTATGREVGAFAGDKGDAFTQCRFSPDGRTLAAIRWSGGKRQKSQLLLFDVPGKQLAKTIDLGEGLLTSGPVFSPNGRWLAITTHTMPEGLGRDPDVRELPQPRIRLIEVAAGTVRETLIAPHGFTHAACCFSPDGRTLATGGYGRVLLWDLTKPPVGSAARRE